jgi:arylsulfatase A-like enzyme
MPCYSTSKLKRKVIGALLLLALAFVPSLALAADRRPNVVILVADDLGYADIGAQSISKDVRTPNIDAIGASGVRFTQGYVSAPVCSPSRAGLLTGRYQEKFGFEANEIAGYQQIHGLPADQHTLADALKSEGYATGAFGKWHLGIRPECRPLQRGFDEFYGFLGGLHAYMNMRPAAAQGDNAIRRGDTPVDEKDYLTDAITREAVSFIDRHESGPFFLYVAYNAVHVPLQVPDSYTAPFANVKPPKRKLMDGMLAAEDTGIGRIIAALHTAGLTDNTLVVFLSDNGGPTDENQSRNAPLRGYKGQIYEGGIRIPMMMSWPGHVPPGRVLDQPVISLDIFPTALAAAAIEPKSELQLDGVNLLPLLMEKTIDRPHQTLYWRFLPQWAIRNGDDKLMMGYDGKVRLFDLSKDVSERNDLISSQPDLAKRLQAKYDAWAKTLKDPLWPCKQEGARYPQEAWSQAAPDAD